MKKIFYSMLMVCALFAAQNVNAQETKQVIFEETFAEGLGNFTIEGDQIWYFNEYDNINYASFCAKGKKGLTGQTFLVSPVIQNGKESTVSFTHRISFEAMGGFEKKASVCVRIEGGEWQKLEGAKFPMGFDQYLGTEVATGEVIIPENFDNKNIQLALCVESYNNAYEPAWYVRDFKVSSVPSDTGIDVIENKVADNKYYDLQGRVVENPAKGLYIHNGKKVIIK